MVTVKTSLLQSMVAKAIKGAANNKMLPLTSMVAIASTPSTETGKTLLSMCTTDSTNYLYISEKIDLIDDIYVVVPVEQFSKLISKLTSEDVSLELSDNALHIVGDGSYRIELPLNEEGNPVRFPNPMADLFYNSNHKIKLADIKSTLAHNKASLSLDNDIPCYTGYYMDKDGVLTTDSLSMCENKVELFDEPVLLSRELIDLLDLFDSEDIDVYDAGSNLVFTSPNCTVFGAKRLQSELEEFNVEVLKNLISQEFTSKVVVHKNELLNALDRISLFVGKYDKNKIKLHFDTGAVVISSVATSGVEHITYIRTENVKEFDCSIDIELFMSQLKTLTSDEVELWYGGDKAIKLVEGDITHILALDEEE